LAARPKRLLLGSRLGPVTAGAAEAALLAVSTSVLPLPVAAISRRRARQVGLITQSWRGWALDLLKAGGIQSAMAAAAGGAAAATMRRYPQRWWIPAASGSVLFGGVLTSLAPVLLDPLFNDFVPLEEGELRRDVLELAAAAGVKVGEVYKVDASRRTTAANAYVTGLGPTKRVVLFDTLLERYGGEEVGVVVAHELAHVRHRDVARGMLFAAILAPSAALSVQRLSELLAADEASANALATVALAAALVSAPLGPIANRLSRLLERRADADSLRWSRAPEAFVSFERKIALQNVADLDPPRWISRLMATHPPTLERIGAAVAFSQTGRAERAP
jgi:STE24 endopeptidase